VIGAEGEQLGVMEPSEALRLAAVKELDLVEVAPTANPPVCRIMDYGKYRYTMKKKSQDGKKKAAGQVKEVKLGSQTSQHDVDFKVNHIRDFLAEGHRVKTTVFFRGRQITHPELGRAMLDKISVILQDTATVEQTPRMEGRSMSMMLIAKHPAKDAVKEPKEPKDKVQNAQAQDQPGRGQAVQNNSEG
jgi:translation initiation factor IF-3